MKYMGSKRRISKYIIPIIERFRRLDQWWVEPFVGGGNIIDKVAGKRLGSDINPNVIAALTSIRDHADDLPKNNKEFCEQDYKNLSGESEFRHKEFAWFTYSYGGKWKGGWARSDVVPRDYVAEAYRAAIIQRNGLSGVKLVVSSYEELEIPPNSLIYCDPPYFSTTSYKYKFDHNKFWEWCRTKTIEGHTVFVSEYTAPDDFECLWQKEMASSLTKDTGSKKGIEKLWIHKSRLLSTD